MPLKIIDRYLLGQFLLSFFICYVSLAGLYIVFDAFTNLDAFLDAAEKRGGLWALMGKYYAFRAIGFFNVTSGVLALVAAMFTLTWIQRHNEMTALMAAGVSRARVARPVIVAAVGVALIAAVGRETLLPTFRKEMSQNPDDLLGDVAQTLKPRYDNKTDILLRGKSTLAAQRRIDSPNFLLPSGLNRYGRQLAADNAWWRQAGGGRPSGYLLKGVRQPEKILEKPALLGPDGEAVVLTPQAADWLEKDEVFVASEVDFEQLTGGEGWARFSKTTDLIRELKNESLAFGADVRVSIHGRLLKPLMDINLLFLGLPLVLSRDNRNLFLAVGLCLAVVVVFLLTAQGAHYLGAAVYISPHLAAWLPLMVFVPVAVAMSNPLRE